MGRKEGEKIYRWSTRSIWEGRRERRDIGQLGLYGREGEGLGIVQQE